VPSGTRFYRVKLKPYNLNQWKLFIYLFLFCSIKIFETKWFV
jgi:hypothetical protein